ncbi:hypothetical protein EDF62_2054 [Leucobacter luti]|uniref:Uncharacterized protein n=1 Tax=Leucobacter luti TaxID=340320 RepID=A0A4R6RWL8_9MICO|nr:hypothetical protein EDF62_2054 [Leucobacter luti]
MARTQAAPGCRVAQCTCGTAAPHRRSAAAPHRESLPARVAAAGVLHTRRTGSARNFSDLGLIQERASKPRLAP